MNFIKKWLNNQDAYAVQKQVRHRYKTPRVQVTGLNDQADLDLMSVENISKQNDDVKYLLIMIDVFSQFLIVRTLLRKTSAAVLSAVEEVSKFHKFKELRSDKGLEFNNRDFKKYMNQQGIHFFTSQNTPKANYSKRVQRTLRTIMLGCCGIIAITDI